jgi:hypothetical protein
MVYIRPQVQVFQELNLQPQAQIQPLPTHLSGGHAKLIRHSEVDEKDLGSLGQYNHNTNQSYLWPDRPAGAVADRDYTRVFIEDALLHYYNSSDEGDTVTSVANRTNQVRSTDVSFADNGSDFLHDDVFKDRGVKVGDVVRLRATVDAVSYELCTSVAGFVAEPVAAVTGDVTEGDNNATTSLASSHVVLSDGDDNCLTATAGGAYDGLAGGHPQETYTIKVVSPSVDGDPTTAVLQVVSGSGTDDVTEVVPSDFGDATPIGTRGAEVTFDVLAESLSNCDSEDNYSNFTTDQEWTLTVHQNYTAPTLTMGSTYVGKKDDTYIIEITRGKTSDKPAQFKVRTTRGLDASGPTSVTGAGSGNTYSVGINGLTVYFSSTSLSKGDRWYVEVTAASEGELQTLVLSNNLPKAVLDNGATTCVIDLYIRKDIEVAANRLDAPPETNWDQTDTEITINSGITAYDESYTDDGDPVALEVHGRCEFSNIFVTVRYWLDDLCGKVLDINGVAALSGVISGPTHPDNPLKYGALKALQNSNGNSVKVTAVCDPSDIDEWTDVLSLLEGRIGIYNLVPLTKNPAVWSLFEAHVDSESSPENARWRAMWVSPAAVVNKVIVNSDSSKDSEVVLAVVEDDPLTSGTQYTYVRVPARNSNFVTNHVRPGDIVRYQFTTDGFGNESYSEFVIDAVVNEDTLRLADGLDAGVSVAEKVEVWRVLSTAEQADELAKSGGFGNRRVRFVWPDKIEGDGFNLEGYFLCAALAALSSGVVPHQGLTHLPINGFTSVNRTDNLFSGSQLDTMAGGGVWIVTQDPNTGTIFTRQALTTGDYSNIAEREEAVVRNLDSISYFMHDILAPYIGVANVSDSTVNLLRAEMNGALKFLMSRSFSLLLGPQLVIGTVIDIRQHLVFADRIIIAIDLTLPNPLNNIEAHLLLVA